MTYNEYRNLMEQLVVDKKSTGENQNEMLVNFTALNHQRMKRLDKKGVIAEEHIKIIKDNTTPIKWVILTESWCGDAAQILPYVNKIAELSDTINLEVLLRDENLELMDAHLTNGGRAIPKLIAFDTNDNTIAEFGPRPQALTELVKEFKKKHGTLTADFKKDIQIWYTKNKGKSIINDIISTFLKPKLIV